MKNTLSKFIIAKWNCDDPAADRFRSRVIPPISGSFKEGSNFVWKNGGGR